MELVVQANRFAKRGDRANEGRTYGNLGNAYDSLGQFDKAVEYHQKRLHNAREVGNRRGEETASFNLGRVYRELGQVDKAVEFENKNHNVSC